MSIRSLLSQHSYLFRSCLPRSIFGGETSGSGGSFKAWRKRIADALCSCFKIKQEHDNLVKVDKKDIAEHAKHFAFEWGYVLNKNKGFLDRDGKSISDSVKRIAESTADFFAKSRSEKDFHLEDIHKILRESGEGDDPSREDFCQRAWEFLSQAVDSYETEEVKHPDELPKLFNLVMPHEVRKHIWDNLSSEMKQEIMHSYEEWREKKNRLSDPYKEKFEKHYRQYNYDVRLTVLEFNALDSSVIGLVPFVDETLAPLYFSRCYLSRNWMLKYSQKGLEEEIFSRLDEGIHLYPRDDNSGKFYLPEQLADELSNEESPFRAGFVAYFEKILECEPDQTRVQDLLSPDHLKTGLDNLAQWIRDNKTLFQSGENDYAFALRGYFMKLRFDRMYKAVEGDAPLKRLLLLFCFQKSIDSDFSHWIKFLSEEELQSWAEARIARDDIHEMINDHHLCHYDRYIYLASCISGRLFFGSDNREREYSPRNQFYPCSNSTLYAMPFMYYLKEYFQPSKDEEVLSQLFKDVLLVRSELKA